MNINPQTDHLDHLLRHHKMCHKSYINLQNIATEKECVILLSNLNKIIPANTDTKQIVKTLYYTIEYISKIQENVEFTTTDIEKCFVSVLLSLTRSHKVDSSSIELFLATIKLIHKFIESHLRTADGISVSIFSLCEHIFTLLWGYIKHLKICPIRIVEIRIRALNFFIFPSNYSIFRYFIPHMIVLYKSHLEPNISVPDSDKISSILVTQSLKWLKITQFNSETIKSIIHSNNNFSTLIIVLITIAFGTKEAPISGITILKCFLQELSCDTQNSPPLLTIGVALSILRIFAFRDTEFPPGMLDKLHTLLITVPDEDSNDHYPIFLQIVPIILKEIGTFIEKRTKIDILLCYKCVIRIIHIFAREFVTKCDTICDIIPEEIEFIVSVPLNIMRTASQHFSKIELCPKEDIHGWNLAFFSFYKILTKIHSKNLKFKTQSFVVYVTASLVRVHHLAILANKHGNQVCALEFIIKAIEMTGLVLTPGRLEATSEVLFLLELLTSILLNTSGEFVQTFTDRIIVIIGTFSLEFYLSTDERNVRLFTNWIKILFICNEYFGVTFFQILSSSYILNLEQKSRIIEKEIQLLLKLSTPVVPVLLDLVLNKYSTENKTFESSILLDPVAPLLKISYFYDSGKWDLALELTTETLEKIRQIFETQITLECVQSYTLAKFWFALLTYQITNCNKLQLEPNYTQIGAEPDSVQIPNIPEGFLVAMEYIYVFLRYFRREICKSFIRELEFVLKTLLFIFNLFSNQFYLFLAFICCSIYLSEFSENCCDFGIQILNEFSEFLIENSFENTFSTLQRIYEISCDKQNFSDYKTNEDILRYSKNRILSKFLDRTADCDKNSISTEFVTNSSSLKTLIESEFEYFALKSSEEVSTNQILIYTHSHSVTLCNTFRRFAANILTETEPELKHISDKRIPFLIIPSFLQRIFKISQILIHSGKTQDATAYIDLGYQISGKLNLFEWRLQFLTLGIQLDIIREKSDRITGYLTFLTSMRNVALEKNCELSKEVFDGFSHLLRLKKLKTNRSEFKDFCCVARKYSVFSNDLILQNFNEILRLTCQETIEQNPQFLSKNEFKSFHEKIQEILTNLHQYFYRLDTNNISVPVLELTPFPSHEHLLNTKISQIQILTNQIRDSSNIKTTNSIYRTATKLINGMQPNGIKHIFMKQPHFCETLSEFYLQAGKSLSQNLADICDNSKCCLFHEKYDFKAKVELQEVYTNCLQSTIPYGSVLALKFSLSSLAQLFSDSNPTLSGAYFNAAFGISFRHLYLNNSKSDSFDLFCFDSLTHNPEKSIETNFLSSLSNLQNDWTVLTISWPQKGDKLYISRLRNSCTPLLFKIPIVKLTAPKFDIKNSRLKEPELTSHEDILTNIFDLLNESNKPENITNKSKWWSCRTKANTALSETLSQIESDWFAEWKGLFLGRNNLAPEILSESTNEILEFISDLTEIPPNQREYYMELLILILESVPLLKITQIEHIIQQILPNLQQNKLQKLKQKLTLKCEDLYEKFADILGKFECTPLSVARGHIFLILDPHLHRIPWENLPILSTQSVSRVPSLHFLFMLAHKYKPQSNIDLTNGFYVLNPQGDLLRCENDFQKLFISLKWHGVSGQPPEGLIDSVSKHDLYVYCGHGSGSEYINKDKLLTTKGKAFTLLMGCSTGRLSIDGPFEYPNMLLLLLLAGFPSIIGTLWFVTDSEINLFTMKLIQEIVKKDDLLFTQGTERRDTLCLAFKHARMSCKLRFITGAAPIIYGLPLY